MMKFAVVAVILVGLSLGQAAVAPTAPPTATVPEKDVTELEEGITTEEEQTIVKGGKVDSQVKSAYQCEQLNGYFPNPAQCSQFYVCANGVATLLDCPEGLYFSSALNVCDWPANVECDYDRCDRRRFGDLSGPEDDAISVAQCPRGYVPVGCETSNPRYSDGVFVSGTKCTAVNSARSPHRQTAVATCLEQGDDNFLFVTSGTWEAQPTVRCPVGYRIINCFLRNAWQHVRAAYVQIEVGGRGRCTSDIECTAGRGCYVQAVCRNRISW